MQRGHSAHQQSQQGPGLEPNPETSVLSPQGPHAHSGLGHCCEAPKPALFTLTDPLRASRFPWTNIYCLEMLSQSLCPCPVNQTRAQPQTVTTLGVGQWPQVRDGESLEEKGRGFLPAPGREKAGRAPRRGWGWPGRDPGTGRRQPRGGWEVAADSRVRPGLSLGRGHLGEDLPPERPG